MCLHLMLAKVEPKATLVPLKCGYATCTGIPIPSPKQGKRASSPMSQASGTRTPFLVESKWTISGDHHANVKDTNTYA
jgi:hypothetical protein